jgi:parvulin-like peptidyl-prolyl isomerase
MLGAVVAVLLAILGVFAYRIYESRVGRPASTVLQVGDQRVSLSYYADRLGPFIQANAQSGLSLPVIEENLLVKLEEEAITVILAEEAGIDLSDNAVLDFVANQFGVPRAGAGSSFDALYRNQLRSLDISDTTYRRIKRAELADAKLEEQLLAELGTAGEQYTLRVVLLGSEEEAADVYRRLGEGGDMGAIAQTESLDLESRQNDGLLPPEPSDLLPEAVRDALQGQLAGALLGPVQVADNWWVFRVESLEERDFTEQQKQQLVQSRLDEQLAEARATLAGEIRRDLDSDDIEWAEDHMDVPETGTS